MDDFRSFPSLVTAAALAVLVVALFSSVFHACDLWTGLDNPLDPSASSYQGYPTVASVDEITALALSTDGVAFPPTLRGSAVLGADSYTFQICSPVKRIQRGSGGRLG